MTFPRCGKIRSYADCEGCSREDCRKNRRDVIEAKEFQTTVNQAGLIKDKFLQMRSVALLCLLRLTGKRRGEIATVRLDDVKIENHLLSVTFSLEKKKRHFKRCPACNEKNTSRAMFCKECGVSLETVEPQSTHKDTRATKDIPLNDPLTQPIVKYIELLKERPTIPKFLFPSTKSVFGQSYVILSDEHLKGRQVFNLIRNLSSEIWVHLFRETVGADIIKKDASIVGAFRVQRRLDLEDMKTGLRYLARYANDVIMRSELEAAQSTEVKT